MSAWISNLKYVVFGVFFIASLSATLYQWWYVWPARKCDQAGAWWDPEDHQCLDPVPVWRITGRGAPGSPASRAQAVGAERPSRPPAKP